MISFRVTAQCFFSVSRFERVFRAATTADAFRAATRDMSESGMDARYYVSNVRPA